MKKSSHYQKQNEKIILEELEARQLFSGGLEGVIVNEVESPIATYIDIDSTNDTAPTQQTDNATAPDLQSHEIVFVDTGVDNYQTLVDDILNNSDTSRNIDVVLLDSNRNGIEQISETLRGMDDLDAIHIISHGDDGSVLLGNTALNADTLAANNLSIALWANSFDEAGDILIYGCNLAETEIGESLVNQLSELTLTDVAASDDLTGQAKLGGNWELEYRTGSVETAVAVSQNPHLQWMGTLDISTGLLGHWTFDADGTDSSGNALNGVLTGDAAVDTSLATNQVGVGKIALDGADDYLELSTHAATLGTLSEGTISGWINTSQMTGSQTLFGIADHSDNLFNFSFATVGVYQGHLFFDVTEGGVYLHNSYTDAIVADGNWHHVALTVDGSGNSLFIDGIKIDPANINYATGNESSTTFLNSVTNVDTVHIGVTGENGGYAYDFDGLIDDVRVYDRALTASDITELQASNDAPSAVDDAFNVTEDMPANIDLLANDTDPENDTLTLLGFERVVASYDAGTSGGAVDPASVAGGNWLFEDTEDANAATGNLQSSGVSPDGATGLNGWNITDGSNTFGENLWYSTTLPAADATLAYANGWSLSADIRMVDDFGDTRTTFMRYGDGTTRFLAYFDLDSNNDLTVELIDDGGNQLINLTNDGNGSADYHNFEIVYDPVSATAMFLSDSERVDNGSWAGETSTNNGIRWGMGSGGGQGSANFHSIEMKVFDQSITTANGATVTNNGDGSVNYDPSTNFTGVDNFAYTMRDSEGHLDSATVNITVDPVNDAPRFTGAPDGNVITELADSSATGYGIAVQADGKSVVGGYAWNGSDYDFMATRYNIDGTLDTTFGGGDGIATIAIGSAGDSAYDITLQSDGKILLTGVSDNGTDKDFALTRLNTDGTLDLDFGTAGSVTTDFVGANDYPKSIVVQSDGKIVIAGHANIAGTNNFAIVRYNSDGTLDTDFDGEGGGDGKVSTDVSPAFPSHIHGMTLQTDGKILVIGDYQDGSRSQFAIVRYNTNGSLDSDWGGDGIVVTAPGPNSSSPQSIAVQTDGRVVAGGTYYNGTDYDFTVLRYNTNGTLDNTFGVNGVAISNFSSNTEYVQDMALQANGKIVLAGYSNNGSNNDFAVARLNSDGSPDTSFGGGDGFAVNPNGSANDAAYGMALQADGSILLAGFSYGTTSEFALQRYTTDGNLDSSFGFVNTLDGLPGYTLGESPVILDSDVQVYDTELSVSDNFSGASLTLVRNGGASGEDLFSETGNLAALTESGNLVLSGVTIGTVTTNSAGTLSLSFNANANQARINETLQSIAYENSGSTPAYVQIDWSFDDGISGAQGTGGAMQVSGSTTVAVTRQLGSQAALILSTLDDVTNRSVPGLSTWTEGEVLQFSDPLLTFGPGGTDGTFSSVLDLNPYFDSGDVDIAALHYVTTDITVGSGANTFDLKVGDVLFALDADQTIGATTYYDNDVHVFRPDTPGNYSAGTISVLLDTLSTADTRAITLVEQDTLVGDVTLLAGTFLYSDSNSPSEIRHFDATGVGTGTTIGTRQAFLNSTGAFNITEEISGLELVEVETIIGGETLSAGSLLASVAVADEVGDNSLSIDDSDIVKLTISKTIMGSATSEAVASMFMDGSNVSLYYSSQDIDALSLTVEPVNVAPTLWDYHHTIDLAATTAIAEYPVKIELVEGFNGFNHGNVQANGEDIRFYDAAGNELNYWIENWNQSGTSTVWVNVETAGTANIDILR